MFRTARWHLVAWNVLVFLLLLSILGGAAYGVFESRIYSGVDDELHTQEQRVIEQLTADNLPTPDSFFAQTPYFVPAEFRTIVTDETGQVNDSPTECPSNNLLQPLPNCNLSSFLPTSKAAVHAVITLAHDPANAYHGTSPPLYTLQDMRIATFRQTPYRVLSFGVIYGGSLLGIVQIARVAAGEQEALHQLRILLLVGGALGIVFAAAGSVFLADRALVPIRKAFARQRQFTADASHELRTPLALIRANAEMLYRHSADDPDSELVGEIIRETDHLNRLVGDLLTLARADAESLKLINRPVDFRSLVADVHEDLHAFADARGIHTALALDGPVKVSGDEVRLRQLLLILMDNALKYTDPGGEVTITVRKRDNRAYLVVQDTGIGIPDEDLPHIFERFYRVDRAREHESGGTGLGLAIAKWIVQVHHGNIKVVSATGQGARFEVELPAA